MGSLLSYIAELKKQSSQQIEAISSQIAQLENQKAPSHKLANELLEWRQKLCSCLLYKYENNIKLAKANYYALGNKAGALLARQVEAQCSKCKRASLYHPISKQLLTNPQDIANSCSNYYSSLYNLANDPNIPKPTDSIIQNFLTSLDIPSVTPVQLDLLSQPFTDKEIIQAIKTLPLYSTLELLLTNLLSRNNYPG